VALYRKLKQGTGDISFENGALHTGMACGNSLMLYYDSLKVSRQKILDHLLKLEKELGDLSEARFPSRKYMLPITFESKRQKESLQRYIETQRPYATYLPDTLLLRLQSAGEI
jgi:urea carboxylase